MSVDFDRLVRCISSIIIRSFVLRRRFRRRVEAAIAAGVLLPEQVEALRRRGPAIGEKPKLWEVYIDGGHKTGYEDSGSASRNDDKAADDWSGIMVCIPRIYFVYLRFDLILPF